jgi:hypothetical protein
MRTIASIVADCIIASAPLVAQGTPSASVIIVAPIYLKPGAEIPLRVAAVGTSLKVLKEEEDWAQVEFNDPQYGPRVGWVQVKLIRVFRPELQPMDLSVQGTPTESAPRETPQLMQPPVPAAGSTFRPHIREGFWFSAGLGFGSLGCQDCIGREDGLSGGLSLGTAVGDRMLVGVGTTGFAKTVEGLTFSVGTLDARVRFYPSRTSGFFLNGGLGLGSVSYAGDSEFGVGVMLGLGWDIRLGKNVSLTPFWNGFAMSNSNVDANVGQLGIAFTIH